MNSKIAKKLSKKAEELSMALLKEQLSDNEAQKVTKKSVAKTEYAASAKGNYAITMSTKGMKSVLKRMSKTTDLDCISLEDVKSYCDQIGRS
tara:strand:+ start:87 stop:362 length:276 start_codon:yes stop_codon:yes gene_type:complete